MSSKVPFHLERRSQAEPATALLLLSHEARDLLRLGMELGLDPLPPVYAVADGFLIPLPQPTRRSFAGALRLRSLANNLLLPVDADLVPALLEDEAAGLVAQRGLIFLPGDRVLEFHPDERLPLSAFLTVERVERRTWEALPEAPALPERLLEIEIEQPPGYADEMLEQGREGIATEDPQPENSSPLSKTLGKMAVQFGKGMAGLGRALHLAGLSRLGANWMARGLNMAPRLSEALLGKQEALLRYLLQKFREGDIDWALRHAVPLHEERARGARPWTGTQLPTHHPFYSLRNILGNSGPASIWFSNSDAYAELRREYTKLAAQATREGDYRRAAFIYGKLLQDYRAAAAVLSQGGLHHDAATLYLSKVGDTLAAAREYEAAGDFDEALDLYRRRGEHVQAAVLLRRLGEEDLAIAEYQLAAAKMAERGHGDYQAGELLLNEAKRPDLALPYYQSGWQRRLQERSVACAIRLTQLYLENGENDKVLSLFAEAEEFLLPPGNDSGAAEFFNEVNVLATWPRAASLREDLQDRALLALASKSRQQAIGDARPADIMNRMFAGASPWPPAVMSDAQFAVQAAVKRKHTNRASPAEFTTAIIQGRIPEVTAVSWAAGAGHLFLGYESGEVFCYRPRNGAVVPLPDHELLVRSIATDAEGERVVVLRASDAGNGTMTSYVCSGDGYRQGEEADFQVGPDSWLCDHLAGAGKPTAGFWNNGNFQFLDSSKLVTNAFLEMPAPALEFRTAIVFPATLLGFDGDHVANCRGIKIHQVKKLGWQPMRPSNCSFISPLIAWQRIGPNRVELAGIGVGGVLYHTVLSFDNGDLLQVATQSTYDPEPFRAVTFVRPGALAAVTSEGVHWLRTGTQKMQTLAVTKASFPNAIACYAHHARHELIVVGNEGNLTQVPFAI
jgi:hypothetical protein